MEYARTKFACDFLFQTCEYKPKKIFTALDVTQIVYRIGKAHKMRIADKNIV